MGSLVTDSEFRAQAVDHPTIKTKAGIHAEIQVNTPAMIFAKE